LAHISDIKLIRTDTTLDLSQKAEKGMPSLIFDILFYSHMWTLWPMPQAMWNFIMGTWVLPMPHHGRMYFCLDRNCNST